MTEILTLKNVPIRPATVADFKTGTSRNTGMNYFLENSRGKLECYVLTPHTNAEQIKKFIEHGKCFVFNSVSNVDFELEKIEG